MKKIFKISETEHAIRTWKVEAENEDEALSIFETKGTVIDEKLLDYDLEIID